MSLRKLREIVTDREAGVLQFVGWQRVGYDLATEQEQQQCAYPNRTLSDSISTDYFLLIVL